MMTVISSLIVAAISVSAYCVETQVSSNKIILFGETESFSDPILEYCNKTYVPLREFAQLLGLEIRWEEKDNKIMIYESETHGNLIPFENSDGMWGYQNQNGEEVISPVYYNAEPFCEGLALVRTSPGQDGHYGFINQQGEMVIDAVYPGAYSFQNGVALVSLSDKTDLDRFGYIDKQGKLICEKRFAMAHRFSENYAVVLKEGYGFPTSPQADVPKKWGYINKKGEDASELLFEHAGDFHQGYAPVKMDGKWGIIDSNFSFVVPCEYDSPEQLEKDTQGRYELLI